MINLLIIAEIIIISFLSVLILDNLAKKFAFFDRPNKTKIHKKIATNISGFGLFFLIINSFFLFDYSDQINYSLNILIFFIFIGLFDDIKNLSASSKLFLMIIPTVMFIQEVGLVTTLGKYENFTLNLNSLSMIFTFFSILLLINAFNYIDGMDGLLSTLSISSLLFFLVILPNTETKFILPFILFLSIFLIFNLNLINLFSKIFIGNSGSIGIGFLFCIIIIHYTQNQNFLHESTVIWFVAFVVYEFLTINIIRIKDKKNPFKRDLNFIFNKMLKKYTKIKTLIICNSINLLFCLIGYIFHIKKYYTFSIFLFIILFFIYLYFRLVQNKN